MQVVGTEPELRELVHRARARGRKIDFVPTMGAFHEGHLELIRRARRAGGLLVVSIFVNPTQFENRDDFDSYPSDLDSDLQDAAREQVEVVFAPATEVVYPQGKIETTVDPGRLGSILEGKDRPGHFHGVATVCAKLFNLVSPDRVYLGQKDAQQLAVLSRMVQDLNFPIEIVACPTVREPDGLAMSSRNARLNAEQRRAAAVLSDALVQIRDLVRSGERGVAQLTEQARNTIGRQQLVRLQYLEVVDPGTFEPVDRIHGQALVAVAAHVGPVRLIDNMIVGTT